MEPSLFGSVRMMVSLSLLATAHPGGTGMVRPSFDSDVVLFDVGEATGLGDPCGVGLVSSPTRDPPVPDEFRLPRIALVVPNPAIHTQSSRTAAINTIQAVRRAAAG